MLLPTLEPCYTPPPTLTKHNWRARAEQKRWARESLIPQEWRLSASLLALGRTDPRAVALQCSFLSERELLITELDELEEVCRVHLLPPV